MKLLKPLLLVLTIPLFLIVFAFTLFQTSKSRSFQFFGEIIPRANTQEKVVALTFDDGPTDKFTSEILDSLAKENVRATFFVLGKDLDTNMHIGREIVQAGHQLGNHSYSHKRMMLKSPAFIKQEIETTNQLIREAGFQGTLHFRPPYGKKLLLLPWFLARQQIKTIMWDVEPDSFGTDADFIVRYTVENTRPGSIILLHPFCESCTGQREAIGRIIDELHNKGYRFVTITELLEYQD